MRKRPLLFFFMIVIILAGCQKSPKQKRDFKTKTRHHSIDPIKLHEDSMQALAKFKEDKLTQLQLRLIGPPPDLEDEYYCRIMQNDYNVEVHTIGCKSTCGDEYYNALMCKEIMNRYGENVFVDVERKIDSLCKIDKPILAYIEKLNIVKRKAPHHLTISNTYRKDIKMIDGTGYINDKHASLFRIAINIHTMKVIKMDTISYEVY